MGIRPLLLRSKDSIDIEGQFTRLLDYLVSWAGLGNRATVLEAHEQEADLGTP